MKTQRLAAAVAAVVLLAVAGCSGDGGAVSADIADAPQVVALVESGEKVVIDVRTPAEFAAGHVEGALNVDVQDPSFADRIAELDKGAEYVVYCRSGNRSEAAIEQMGEAGFTALVNGGAFEELAAAGAPVAY